MGYDDLKVIEAERLVRSIADASPSARRSTTRSTPAGLIEAIVVVVRRATLGQL